METNYFGKYFGIGDYVALNAHDRAIVDKWLDDNHVLDKAISLVQEIEGGESLLLSGPKMDEDGLTSEIELEEKVTLEENTFPWEILKKIS
jgi:hypothetical protein